MKHSEEFKYQDQLDATSQLPRRRVSKGGTLMLVFFVGVIMAAAIPVGFKMLTNSMLMTMAAHKPVEKIKATETVKSVAIEKTVVERPKAKKVEKTIEKAAEKIVEKKIAKPAIEKVAAKKKEAPKAKKVAKADVRKEAVKAPVAAVKAAVPTVNPKSRAVGSVMEIAQGPNAEVLQEKADEEFLSTGGGAAPIDAEYRTIANASYSKETLASCKQRCILSIKDANGQVQQALINGAEFASILSGHKGTINLTGKKRLLKNHSVFMVQNITFNLAPGQTKQADDTNTAKPRFPKQQATATQDYEDLSLDLKR